MTDSTLEPDRLGDRLLWSRHANPWSVWTLVPAYPVLVLTIYRRSRPLLAGTLLFVALNPLPVSPPEIDETWATRAVLGERVWIERGIRSSVHTPFVVACAPVYVFTLRSAVERRPARTAVGTVVSVALMLVFFGRMVGVYEEEYERRTRSLSR
ncbi:DUF6653 family protein [Natronorarus salvus]|uniref:DUF6653 family protein n=1 Tax=Natronorarus salvus TaxID=3117733 RepID=UPI002F26C0C7